MAIIVAQCHSITAVCLHIILGPVPQPHDCDPLACKANKFNQRRLVLDGQKGTWLCLQKVDGFKPLLSCAQYASHPPICPAVPVFDT